MSKKKTVEKISTIIEASVGDCLTVGEVFKAIPYELVERALLSIDRSKRQLGSFGDQLVVYFVILMNLFADTSYGHIVIKLNKAMSWLSGGYAEGKEVSAAAITQARQRVTFKPLKALFELVASPLALNTTPGAFFFGRRLVSVDGVVFDVEDSKENAVGFGYPKNKNGNGAYPQVRCVAIVETATRAVIDLAMGAITASSENSLVVELFGRLKRGTVCLADRLYPGFDLCKTVIDAGADFVWRVQSGIELKPIKQLGDKSYLAKMYRYTKNGKRRIEEDFLIVRVIKYRLPGQKEQYRLITTILDPKEVPAYEFAKLYPKRWAQETFHSEIKETLRNPRVTLRSKKPEQVMQELYGMFIAHYLVRAFMFEASTMVGLPPDELSFDHTVFALQHYLPQADSFSPQTTSH